MIDAGQDPEAHEHPNALLARDVWDATARGDAEAVLAFYAPDLIWRSHGLGRIATEVRGARPVLEYLAGIADVVDDLRSELLDVFAGSSGAVIRYHTSARRGDRKLESDLVMLLEIRAGRVTAVDVVPIDAEVEAAFWTDLLA